MRKLLRCIVVLAAVVVSGACSATSDDKPPPTQSACPQPTSGTAESDFGLVDPVTCEYVFVGEASQTIRSILGRNYEIKLLLPIEGQSFSCVKDGQLYHFDEETPVLTFCDGHKVFLVTYTGIQSSISGTKIASVWYRLSFAESEARFAQDEHRLCAAGYITTKRPKAQPAADLEQAKIMEFGSETGQVPPWRFIAYGQQAALSGKTLNVCATAKPSPISS